MEAGFIGYRDFCDQHKRIESMPFSNKFDILWDFIKDLQPSGGGDECEDLIGALNKVLSSYTFSKTGLNIIFLICDSPCHGKQYHEANISDD